MIRNVFSKTQIPFIEKLLDISSIRQRVIAGNVANVQTPGYTGRKVDFEKSLRNAETGKVLHGLESDERHMAIPGKGGLEKNVVVEDTGVAPDLEKEMALSAENQLLYHTSISLISRQFRALHAAVRGRI